VWGDGSNNIDNEALSGRAEIEGAIRAVADHSNLIAAELLASAAIDVIGGVCREAGITTMSGRIFEMVRPEKTMRLGNSSGNPTTF
jgi:hypothetical protein